MTRLHFSVQGSAKAPYALVATGEGETLHIRCSCPQGSRAGRFCKHAAALLLGDVTRLVAGFENMEALAKAARGSPYKAMALDYEPAPPRPDTELYPVDSLDALLPIVIARVSPALHRVELDPPDDESRGLHVHRIRRRGDGVKKLTLSLQYDRHLWEDIHELRGDRLERVGRQIDRPRTKCWTVRGNQTVSYGLLERAAFVFLEQLNEEVETYASMQSRMR